MSAAQTPPAGGPAGAAGQDPSMEDILASIRRILSEEETAAPTPTPAPQQEEKSDEVLVLDQSMMVPEHKPEEPAPVPAPDVSHEAQPEPQSPHPATPPTLVAPEAAAAAASSVGSLLRTLTERSVQVHRGGPTIEDMVREELRPLLKQWLDTNLPDLVERLVRAEIERVVGRAVP